MIVSAGSWPGDQLQVVTVVGDDASGFALRGARPAASRARAGRPKSYMGQRGGTIFYGGVVMEGGGGDMTHFSKSKTTPTPIPQKKPSTYLEPFRS